MEMQPVSFLLRFSFVLRAYLFSLFCTFDLASRLQDTEDADANLRPSLTFSFLLRGRNPISTRIELASLGLAGVFWLGEFARLMAPPGVKILTAQISPRSLPHNFGISECGCRVLCFGNFTGCSGS